MVKQRKYAGIHIKNHIIVNGRHICPRIFSGTSE
jgi:hypothetical protein